MFTIAVSECLLLLWVLLAVSFVLKLRTSGEHFDVSALGAVCSVCFLVAVITFCCILLHHQISAWLAPAWTSSTAWRPSSDRSTVLCCASMGTEIFAWRTRGGR